MLGLTKKTGYGLIAMTHLARHPRRLVSARQIAERFGVPASLLMNVLKELAAAGYVESVRGARGGYRLARRPDEVNLADLVADLEGPVRLAECVTDPTGDRAECTCQAMARCPISDPVHRVHRRLRDFLKKVTLAEILDPARALSGPGAEAWAAPEEPRDAPEAADLPRS
jgi:Rrf2 family protein